MSSPIFVPTFADGTTTRKTTHRADGKLDLGRGIRLSQAAYKSRKKQPPPALIKGHFEKPPNGDGGAAVIRRTYTASELRRKRNDETRSHQEGKHSDARPARSILTESTARHCRPIARGFFSTDGAQNRGLRIW